MERMSRTIRRAMLAVAQNEALFMFTAFVVAGVLSTSLLYWYQDAVDLAYRYIVVPWGMALCLLRIAKRPEAQRTGKEIAILFMLLAWIVVPFAIRFGLTFNNATSWQGSVSVYFAIYALASERDAATREKRFDLACALFAALGFVLGTAMLWCAWNVQTLDPGEAEFGFGIYDRMILCHGVHYNLTGMVSVCCLMMALAGAERAKKPVVRVGYAVSAIEMMLVIVLTQSRTARYAMIIALGAGAYAFLLRRWKNKGIARRQIAAIAAACAVVICGYAGAKVFTDAALSHYERVYTQRAEEARPAAQTLAPVPENTPAAIEIATAGEPVTASENAAASAIETAASEPVTASAIETAASEPVTASKTAPVAPAEQTVELEARAPVDGSLSGRTEVWRTLIEFWKESPKYFFIGNGTGRTGSIVVRGTSMESLGALMIHNAYLQYIADYGIIGFGLLMAFALCIAPAVLRAFFGGRPGMTAMGMMAIAALLTGLMESQPLGAMTPINMVFFFALAMMKSTGSEKGA